MIVGAYLANKLTDRRTDGRQSVDASVSRCRRPSRPLTVAGGIVGIPGYPRRRLGDDVIYLLCVARLPSCLFAFDGWTSKQERHAECSHSRWSRNGHATVAGK